MRICVVYDGEYPWDVRMEKVTTTLSEDGHEVHLVCRNLSGMRTEERAGKIDIHRLRHLFGTRLNKVMTFPVFLNPVWLKKVFDVTRTYGVKLLIVRDLPLALTGIMVGRVCGVPVVLDLAENYPELLKQRWKYGRPKLLDALVRNPVLAKGVEKLAIRYAAHVIVVANEARERLEIMGVASHRVSVVMNTPRHRNGALDERRTVGGYIGRQRSRFCLIYVGGLEPGRGL